MPQVSYKGQIIAQSEHTERVEGNHYFPEESLDTAKLKASNTQYSCPWKGAASYYHLEVDGQILSDAVWAYHQPKDAARNIAGHYAFDRRQVDIHD